MSSSPVSRGTLQNSTTGSLDMRPTLRRSGNVRQQQQTLAAIFPDTKEGRKALDALKSAASELRYDLQVIHFEKIDFGDTVALDKFYSASVAVADVTDRSRQANLFYHLGLRESFDMRQNIVTYVDEELSHQAIRRPSAIEPDDMTSQVMMYSMYKYYIISNARVTLICLMCSFLIIEQTVCVYMCCFL